ncbi:Holliday junction resolvase-like protein [Candidatus Malacoplasma girerdii]|uniref:Putative pre-16S rRNA nuclease n=1 Tax=Candidatus Malacoplasma girerdii TaxID=1318617 RepID=A0A097STL4_9BACT|nr:Holliday junction resolvase-like protein [Candidatus Malacoplasma girerdii]ASJ89424.1 MAG: putative pre-16S rRNA nuclease [Candidatus Malacoplasma girerdii]
MKILAIDFGLKRIGLAIGDTDLKIANGLTTIEIKNNNFMLAIHQIKKNINNYGPIDLILLGYPTKLDNQTSSITLAVENFKNLLSENIKISVQFYDENYSTKNTISFYKEFADLKMSQIKKIKDKMAAQYFLQKYLDEKK